MMRVLITCMFLMVLMLCPAYADLVGPTGMWKIEGNKCLQEWENHTKNAREWKVYDCIELIKQQEAQLKILSTISTYSNFLSQGLTSEKAFNEIAKKASLLVSIDASHRQIDKTLQKITREAQEKYPMKKAN